jgi:hypothetical protein
MVLKTCSWSQLHANGWNEVDLVAQQAEDAKPKCVRGMFFLCDSRTYYRENSPRVKVSYNQVDFYIKNVLDTY